jgi:hypothetical protein
MTKNHTLKTTIVTIKINGRVSITRPRLFQKPLSRLFIIHYSVTLFSLSVLFLFYKDFYGVVVIRTFIVFLTNH